MLHNLKDINRFKEVPFFFIVGRPRSGTTLLMAMLEANPATIIPVECPIIKNLYPKYGKRQLWSKKDLSNFYTDLTEQTFYSHYKFTDLSFDFDSIQKDLLLLEGKCTFGEIIKLVYLNYNSLFPKEEIRVIGDKNPDSSNFIDHYIKIFPEAKYIHIIRDYRDHIMSMFKAGFGIPSVAMLAFRWKMNFKKLERVRSEQPDKFLLLRYEDLVSEPEKNLRAICDFLGIEFFPVMLHHQEFIKDNELYPEQQMKEYQKSVIEPITTLKLYNWKKNMPASNVKISDMVVGKYAEIAGYERDYFKRNLYYYIIMLPIWVRRAIMLTSKLLVDFLPYKTRISIRYSTPIYTRLKRGKH
jgi:hypothetical protein